MRLKGLFLTMSVLVALTAVANAQTFRRRATLISSSNPNEGRCTVSVFVDGAADVEIRGDDATLRNVTGASPHWQRFECTAPLPNHPADLHLRAVEGNGRMTLTHDTNYGGVADVRVTNLEGGDQLFTFDVFWNRDRSNYSNEADRAAVADEDAVQSCRTAVENRIRNDGYRYVRFGSISVDDHGSNDWVSGTATADRRYNAETFGFSCRVSPYDGQVLSLDVTRQ